MKKPYVKPQAFFESFELSASIAGACAVNLHFGEGGCFYTSPSMPGKNFFTETLNCNADTQDGSIDGACHQGPINEIFSS